jgi:hypothetical protein
MLVNFLISAAAAVVLIAPVMVLAHRYSVERQTYCAFLILLPLIYAGFGLFAAQSGVVQQELLWGIPFFFLGTLALVLGTRLPLYITAVAWIAHGGYDLLHDQFFINSGVWWWYPVACAVIDIAVGAYLLVVIRRW